MLTLYQKEISKHIGNGTIKAYCNSIVKYIPKRRRYSIALSKLKELGLVVLWQGELIINKSNKYYKEL